MGIIKLNDIVKYHYGSNPDQLYIVKHCTDHWVRIVRIDDAQDSRWVHPTTCTFIGKASDNFKFSNKKKCPVVALVDTTKVTTTEVKPDKPVRTGAPNKPLKV